jgi:DNA-binding response OmpR family regulator
MSKILLIEDEERFATMVQLALKARLLNVEWAKNGTDGLYLLKTEAFDAAIVDWNLPDMEGIEIVRRYRQVGGVTPILMLTGRSAVKEKVTGFDCGADDYLTKPFQPEELYVRVRSLMRRPKSIQSNCITIGDLTIVPELNQAKVAGMTVKLTKKEFALLEILARHKGVTVNSEAIAGKVWSPGADVSAETVRTHVANLKAKLRKTTNSSGWEIKNVYGGGYILEEA